jgi:hypothetical protein
MAQHQYVGVGGWPPPGGATQARAQSWSLFTAVTVASVDREIVAAGLQAGWQAGAATEVMRRLLGGVSEPASSHMTALGSCE